MFLSARLQAGCATLACRLLDVKPGQKRDLWQVSVRRLDAKEGDLAPEEEACQLTLASLGPCCPGDFEMNTVIL